MVVGLLGSLLSTTSSFMLAFVVWVIFPSESFLLNFNSVVVVVVLPSVMEPDVVAIPLA